MLIKKKRNVNNFVSKLQFRMYMHIDVYIIYALTSYMYIQHIYIHFKLIITHYSKQGQNYLNSQYFRSQPSIWSKKRENVPFYLKKHYFYSVRSGIIAINHASDEIMTQFLPLSF